jgi:hypothetical protein
MSVIIKHDESMMRLPETLIPGTKALLFDPAGGRACRNGDAWCPVTLTGREDVWNLSGTRCVEIETSSGRGKWFDADSIRVRQPRRTG